MRGLEDGYETRHGSFDAVRLNEVHMDVAKTSWVWIC